MSECHLGRPALPSEDLGAFGAGEFQATNPSTSDSWGGDKDSAAQESHTGRPSPAPAASISKMGGLSVTKSRESEAEWPAQIPWGPAPDRQPSSDGR